MRWNAHGIFRPGAEIAEVRVCPSHLRKTGTRDLALECAGTILSRPEMGTIWARFVDAVDVSDVPATPGPPAKPSRARGAIATAFVELEQDHRGYSAAGVSIS